jgi:hypothetical protein
MNRMVKNICTLLNEGLQEILEENDEKKRLWIRKWMQRRKLLIYFWKIPKKAKYA